MPDKLLVSFSEAASLLSISRSSLYDLSNDGRLGPIPLKIGRRSLLNFKELEAWTDAGMPPRSRWKGLSDG